MIDFYDGIILITGAALILLMNPDVRDHFRNKTKDRRKECLSDALENFHLFIDNTEHKVLSYLPEADGKRSLDVETVRGERRQEIILDVDESELKGSWFEVMDNGIANVKLVRNNVDVEKHKESGVSSRYTDEEIRVMYEESVKDKTRLEGENIKLRARVQEDVRTSIGHANNIVSSRHFDPDR